MREHFFPQEVRKGKGKDSGLDKGKGKGKGKTLGEVLMQADQALHCGTPGSAGSVQPPPRANPTRGLSSKGAKGQASGTTRQMTRSGTRSPRPIRQATRNEQTRDNARLEHIRQEQVDVRGQTHGLELRLQGLVTEEGALLANLAGVEAELRGLSQELDQRWAGGGSG